MHMVHANARTTPAVRAEIARSAEPTGTLAQRYGVSTETIRKWRKRGVADCRDRSSRPHKLPWKASDEERAVICALRRATGFPLDDLTFIVTHFLPHLNRDAVYRILRAEGLGRLPPASHPRRPVGSFKEYELGFVHMDVKHLPKLRTADGELRRRYLFVAIDRRSRFVHLAVKDDETEARAVAFLNEALAAFPFQVTHVLTDRGSCFTAEGFATACQRHGVEHRKTRPYTPRTNGMAERFNGRVQREVLGITLAPAIATSSACSRASTPPTTPAASACWTGALPTRSSASASREIGAALTLDTGHHLILASCQRPCWSSSVPRTPHNQTVRAVPKTKLLICLTSSFDGGAPGTWILRRHQAADRRMAPYPP
jgi:transposase InsO family protein